MMGDRVTHGPRTVGPARTRRSVGRPDSTNLGRSVTRAASHGRGPYDKAWANGLALPRTGRTVSKMGLRCLARTPDGGRAVRLARTGRAVLYHRRENGELPLALLACHTHTCHAPLCSITTPTSKKESLRQWDGRKAQRKHATGLRTTQRVVFKNTWGWGATRTLTRSTCTW